MTEPLEYPYSQRDQQAVEAAPEPEPEEEPLDEVEPEPEEEPEVEVEPEAEPEQESDSLLRGPEQHAAGELEMVSESPAFRAWRPSQWP